MKLYVFNPDTDMALADNQENYLPAAPIRRMAEDLALLPSWYAQPGSLVLAPSAYNTDFLQQMRQLFSLPVQLVVEQELPNYADVQVMPWGWNPALRRRMLKGGILERRLPSMAELEAFRRYSSRTQTSFFYLIFKNMQLEHTCGCNFVIDEEHMQLLVEGKLKELEGGYLLKAGWSGSGKGLRWCRQGMSKATEDWCRKELEQHGYFMAEPICDKVEDFAMEFYSDGQGKVPFTGYSRFMTDSKGAYKGNVLASDEEVERWIQHYVPLQVVIRIRETVQQGLELLYGNCYTGPLGVDMMICRQKEGHPYAIHPFVEINLRMTMGIVSHRLYADFVAPGKEGIFSIDSFPDNGALQERHGLDSRDYPLVVENGRIVSGYCPLVPITPRSRYRAYVKIGE